MIKRRLDRRCIVGILGRRGILSRRDIFGTVGILGRLGIVGAVGGSVALTLLLVSLPAFAAVEFSNTGQPQSHEFPLAAADIRGFGDVVFGMGVDEVETAVAKVYPEGVIEREFEPVQETQLLHLTVPQLVPAADSPSPGPATVTYVFGARSERLMGINIHWYVEGDATSMERDALLAAGAAYVGHLLGYYWEPLSTSRGFVIGPNAVILFTGRDLAGRGVEVIAAGVPLDVERLDGTIEHRAIEAGPASLSIRLAAQPDNPDVFTIPAGDF